MTDWGWRVLVWLFSPQAFQLYAFFSIGLGVTMALSPSPSDVRRAHIFFAIGFVLAAGRLAVWLIELQEAPMPRPILAFVFFGTIGCLWLIAYQWVGSKLIQQVNAVSSQLIAPNMPSPKEEGTTGQEREETSPPPILSPKPEETPPEDPTMSLEVFSGDQYKPDNKVHGIPWRADLMDLWLSISNVSGTDYKDFYVSIEGIAMEEAIEGVSLGFYEIAQVAGLAEFRTQLYGDIRSAVGGQSFDPPGRPIEGANLENTVMSVRADSPRFPDGSSVRFVVAVTNVRNKPGPKIKPAVAGVECRYTVRDQRWQYRILLDIRDMDNITKKRSDDEVTRIGSRLSPGTASGVTKRFPGPEGDKGDSRKSQ